jgi:hypothetical protein
MLKGDIMVNCATWARRNTISLYLLLSIQFYPRRQNPCLPSTFLLQGAIVSASHPVVSQIDVGAIML